jgi:TonB-linked SusC/RagA family outer membrane protein
MSHIKLITLTMMALALSSSLVPLQAEVTLHHTPDALQQAKLNVSGVVSDDNGPLEGVAVIEKGTTNGVLTDNAGRYSISVASASSILEISSLGYETQQIIVGGRAQINVVLKFSSMALDETVVVGYGTMRRKDVTGAIASADLEAFRTSQNVNIMQSLKGSVPGLTVQQGVSAGQELSLQVRGLNTLSGNTQPLIVVDGIIYTDNMNYINPADVKSIDVLKDASSKAIYGAQAANGVIQITTFQGEKNKKTEVHYSGSVSVSGPTTKYRLMNAAEKLEQIKGIYYTKAYLAPDYTTPNPDFKWSDTELGPEMLEGIEKGVDYDWYGALSRTPVTTNHNISIRGGSSNVSSYLSLGYTTAKGIVKNDDFSRYTARVNLTYDVNSWLTVGVLANGSFADYSGESPAGYIRTQLPFRGPKDENGDYRTYPKSVNDTNLNPFLVLEIDDKQLRNELSGLGFVEINFPWVEGLKYKANYNKTFVWANAYSGNPYGAKLAGTASKVHGESYSQTFDNILSYEREINDHNINVTLVYGARTAGYDNVNASGSNYSNFSLSYNNLGEAVTQTISSTAWTESNLYQMGRINYGYKNRYLFTATLRRDGFSGFAENNKFGLFPSAAVGWTVSNEPFWNHNIISYLKIRVGYGSNGNLTSRYSSLARVTSSPTYRYIYSDGGQTANGQALTTLSNPDLKWETTAGLNIGLDYSLIKDRISGSFEYYSTKTHNLLWDRAIPSVTGFTSIKSNVGEVQNSGVELTLKAIPVKTKDFTWDFNLSFSANRNKITHLLGDRDGDGIEDDLIASGLFIGHPIGTVYNYEVDGLYQLGDEIPTGYYPGTYRIVDHDGIEGITATDKTILGHTEPAYTIGLQTNLSYKRLTFRAFVHSIQGGKDGYLAAQVNNYGTSTGVIASTNCFTFLDMWSPVNPDARDPQSFQVSKVTGNRYQQRNFVRLADVSLAYSLGDKALRWLGIKDLQVYLSGKNLLTFTDWDGWDPETGQGINSTDFHQVMRTVNLGVELTF